MSENYDTYVFSYNLCVKLINSLIISAEGNKAVHFLVSYCILMSRKVSYLHTLWAKLPHFQWFKLVVIDCILHSENIESEVFVPRSGQSAKQYRRPPAPFLKGAFSQLRLFFMTVTRNCRQFYAYILPATFCFN